MSAASVFVLLSSGRHPASGAVCAADMDSRAVTLAAGLGGDRGMHVGSSSEPALSDYLAVGLERIDVIPAGNRDDVCRILGIALGKIRPRVVIAGMRAEHGMASGMLPYEIAATLKMTLVANVLSAKWVNDTLSVERVGNAPGVRDRLLVPTPAVLTVGSGGPGPRSTNYRRRMAGRIEIATSPFVSEPEPSVWAPINSIRVPKWIEQCHAVRAVDRIRAIRDKPWSGGKILTGLSAADSADNIITYLRAYNLIPTVAG